MTGIPKKLRNFDESAKEFSDVVLVVGDEKFYVCKMYLATHSSYFKSLFSANFNESNKSEITLNDINSYDFLNFLELIHGESTIDDNSVFGILKLADMYDAKTAIRRCEKFLIKESEHSMKEKFETAYRYKMDKLKKKCISAMKSVNDVLRVAPKNANDIDPSTWQQLFNRAAHFYSHDASDNSTDKRRKNSMQIPDENPF